MSYNPDNVNAGEVTASITKGGATAKTTYTITPAGLSAPSGLAWNGAEATWGAVANASGYAVQLYKDDVPQGGAVSVTGATSHTFNITEAGIYTFTVQALGNKNYTDSAVSERSSALNFYMVTATAGTGGSIRPTSALVQQGDSASFTVTPDSDYALDKLTLDGADVTAQVTNGAYTISDVQKGHAVHAAFKLTVTPPVVYTIIYGAGQQVIQGDAAVFISDAPFEKFSSVQVDGKDIEATNYVVESGSTKVTLTADYTSSLSLGEHDFAIVSSDGEATTTFTVKAAEPTPTPTPTDEPLDDVPETGDDSNLGLWIEILIIALAGLAVCGVVIYKRKRAR